MIKNILFDMGNVIILYMPELIMDEKGILDEADRQIMYREVFHAWEWGAADAGLIDTRDIAARCLPRVPEHLRERAEACINRWYEPVHEVYGMADFIREMKAKGIGIYLLSNAPDSINDYWDKVEASKYFDGRAVSFELKLVKPTVECFNAALDKFGIKAEETIFVDDLIGNLEGAKAVGMRTVQFKPGMDPHIIEDAMKYNNSL